MQVDKSPDIALQKGVIASHFLYFYGEAIPRIEPAIVIFRRDCTPRGTRHVARFDSFLAMTA